MLFGRPSAPQVDWEAMYFYQKVQHLFDHGANWMISKLDWWLPSVATGMIFSLLLLSENPIGEGAAVVLPTLSPVARTPSFGIHLPEREAAQAEEHEDELIDDEEF